jgi:AraC family transcriptional regulator
MIPKIEYLHEKKLVGKRLSMSIGNNRTGELWRSFMPLRREILNLI